MKWLEPKNDWKKFDGISYSDLNRIENNTKLLRDSLIYSIKGFNISVIGDSTTSADMQDWFTISSGGCITINDDGNIIPIKINSAFTKTIEAFSVGNENGSLCPGVALANDQWMYVFLLYNTELETFDYAIDDNSFGSHLSSIAGFNKSVLVSVFQINEIDTSVFKIHPIFSIGDRFYLYRGDHGTNYSTSDYNYRCAYASASAGAFDPLLFPYNAVHELKNLNGNYMLPIGIRTEFFGDAEFFMNEDITTGIGSRDFYLCVFDESYPRLNYYDSNPPSENNSFPLNAFSMRNIKGNLLFRDEITIKKSFSGISHRTGFIIIRILTSASDPDPRDVTIQEFNIKFYIGGFNWSRSDGFFKG